MFVFLFFYSQFESLDDQVREEEEPEEEEEDNDEGDDAHDDIGFYDEDEDEDEDEEEKEKKNKEEEKWKKRQQKTTLKPMTKRSRHMKMDLLSTRQFKSYRIHLLIVLRTPAGTPKRYPRASPKKRGGGIVYVNALCHLGWGIRYLR